MRFSVTCGHGVTRSVDATAGPDADVGAMLRSLVLACPMCWYEATSAVNYPERWGVTGRDESPLATGGDLP